MTTRIGVSEGTGKDNVIKVFKETEAGFMVVSGDDGEKLLLFDLEFIGATLSKGVLVMPLSPEQLKTIQVVLDAACHVAKKLDHP